jgi:autotransporter-associated beta strand protein
MKTKQLRLVFGALIALLYAAGVQAATFTATTTGNYGLAATWGATTSSQTGTITANGGNTSLTGSGTTFTTQLAPGDAVYNGTGTFLGYVASIANNTSATLKANSTTTVSGVAWASFRPPATGDTATVPSGISVSIPNTDANRNTSDLIIGGTFNIGAGGQVNGIVLGNVTINAGGTLNGSGGSQAWTFSGNVTNNGNMTQSGGYNNSVIYTYNGGSSGSPKTLAGNITNNLANITGVYQNLGLFLTGVGNNNTANSFSGSGTFSNYGSIYLSGNGTQTFPTTLVTTPAGNMFLWVQSGAGGTIPAQTFYNFTMGTLGNVSISSPANFLYNLTVGSGDNITWPAVLNLGGALNNNASSSSTMGSTFAMTSDLILGGTGSGTYTIPAPISGAFNLTKRGSAIYTLSGNNTYGSASTATTVGGGQLNLDYGSAVNSKLPDATKLAFGGLNGGLATLNLQNGGSAHNEVVASTTINAGAARIARSSGTSVMRLNSIARNTGGTLDLGAASIADSDNNNVNGVIGGYLTVASLDWGKTVDTGASDTAITAYTAYNNINLGGSIADSATSNVRINGGTSGNITLASSTTTINTLDQNFGFAATIDPASNVLRMGPVGGILIGTGRAALTIGAAAGSGTLTAGGADSTAGELVLINHSANSFTINSVIADNGSSSFPVTVTKSGTGTVTLNTANTYTGPTYVNQGTLTVGASGSIAGSAIIVASGATLSIPATTFGLSAAQDVAGSGTISGALATLGANGTIHPGGNGIYGTLTFANGLTCNSASTCKLTFDLDDPFAAYNDKIAVTGTLTCNGANIVINPSANFRTGIYTLATATSVSGTFNSTVTFTTGTGTATLSYTSTSVILTVSSYASCPNPANYAVSGTGTFCSDSGATLGLANSDIGTTYQLFRGATPVDVGVAGTGSGLSPVAWAGLTTAGTYTVWATNGCGSAAQMTGNAIVNQTPSGAFNLTGGDGCSSPGVTIGLSGSESGVSYQLLKDGSNAGSPVTGTGSPISFGLKTAAGVYTVQGTVAGCATVTMAGSPGSVTITATPNVPTAVSAGAGDSQVTVSWTAPGSGPVPTGYNVKRSTASGSGYTTLPAGADVSSSPFTDTTAINGTAYYYVISALNGSCESSNSTPEAGSTPNPSFSAFTITGNTSSQAGAPNQLTVTAVDSTGTPVTGVAGDISLTFSGLSAGPDSSLSTINDKNGTPRNLGVPTTITFANGVGSTASGAAVLVAHKAEVATLNVTDGTHDSISTGGAGLNLTVSLGADSAYRISAATSTPVVGATNMLTIAIVDQYQNPSTFIGTKNITFGGLAAAPDGSLPNVDGTPFGTPTPVDFNSAVSVALVAYKVENNKLLTATDGTLSATGPGGSAPTLSPAVAAATQLGIVIEPSTTAAAGVAFAQQPVIVVLDAFANVVSNSTASVASSASADTLQGTTSVSANGSNGRATFSGLSLTNVATVTLTFSSSGLASTNSSAITVSGGPVAALAWTTQPGDGIYGLLLGTQPVLKTVDQFGNPTTAGLADTVNISVNVGSGGGTLLGTTSYNIGTSGSNGVISFTDLRTSTAGNKQLTATGLGAPPTGMAIWLKADVASSVMTNGSGIVTNWLDQSGNGNNFSTTIGSGGNGIRYTNSVVAGRKAVTFNATSAGAATELMNSTYANSSNVISVFVVAKKTVSGTGEGGTQRSCASLSTASGTHDYFTLQSFEIDYGSDNKTPRFYRNNVGAGLSGGSFDPSTAYHVDEFIANASQNGFWLTTASGTTTGGTSGQVGNFNINRFSVGGGLDTGSVINNPFAGDVCELLVYTADMSSQRSVIESYLKGKWLTTTPLLATTATFNVAPATVVPNITVNDKPYDGGIAATIATRSLSGVVGSDDVNLDSSGTALFADKDVGANKPVSVTGLSLGGITATNYVLSTTSTNAVASITPRTLNVTATGINKFNDGTTNATVTLSDDRLLGENLTTAYTTAGFEDSLRATNKPVHVFGISITGGGDASNYALGNITADTVANIMNNAPLARTAHFSRPSGIQLQILITDLLTNATDADLDTLSLAGVSVATTNGTPLSTDSTYVYVDSNTVDDAFTYTVQDGWSGTNSGTVLVSIVASNPGQVQSIVVLNGIATVTFAGTANYPYTAERSTNVLFSGSLRTWSTNAPAGGVFQIEDDFSDLGAIPDQGYYRLRTP